MLRTLLIAALPALFLMLPVTGCLRVKSDPVKVEPIEINVTVRVKVDRELDNFFDELDEKDATIEPEEE